VIEPEVFIGDMKAQVTFAGLALGFVGVYQVNIVAPPVMATDRLYIRSQGKPSNVLVIDTPKGQNAANVRGAFQALFPTAQTAPATFSPLLLAARFTASMEIAQTARPFAIAAVSEVSSSVILVDPARGTFDGSVTLPTDRSRRFDFSQTEIEAIDFRTCGTSSLSRCFPFPNSVLPPQFQPPDVVPR
jgi:hypothetical protein